VIAGLWARVVAIAAVVGAVLLAIARIRQGGRDAERAEAVKRDLEAIRMAENAERIVDATDDLSSLRRKWTRPR
jgi:Flp pilus assembly protein TadB